MSILITMPTSDFLKIVQTVNDNLYKIVDESFDAPDHFIVKYDLYCKVFDIRQIDYFKTYQNGKNVKKVVAVFRDIEEVEIPISQFELFLRIYFPELIFPAINNIEINEIDDGITRDDEYFYNEFLKIHEIISETSLKSALAQKEFKIKVAEYAKFIEKNNDGNADDKIMKLIVDTMTL